MKMLVEFQRRPRLAGRLSPQKAEGITSSCRGTNSSHVAVAGAAAAGRPVTWYTIKQSPVLHHRRGALSKRPSASVAVECSPASTGAGEERLFPKGHHDIASWRVF